MALLYHHTTGSDWGLGKEQRAALSQWPSESPLSSDVWAVPGREGISIPRCEGRHREGGNKFGLLPLKAVVEWPKRVRVARKHGRDVAHQISYECAASH